MKVLNLRCDHDHAFEGWFASEADFQDQAARGVVQCPLCGSPQVTRLPSAPRLNISGARAPAAASVPTPAPAATPEPATLQAMWLQAVSQVLKNTEDVGDRFPEEARRIHYGEAAERGIRGQASPQQRAELAEEGIEVLPLPLPSALKGTAH
ncbi:MAG: DUF1178 family protein [Pseudomonadota bacterium]